MKNFTKVSKTLEFDKVLALLADCALTDGAKKKALSLMPETDLQRIERKKEETKEAKRLLGVKGSPSFYGVCDIDEIVERASKGARLQPVELLSVAKLLTCTRSLKNYPDEELEASTPLYVYFSRLLPERNLEKAITSSILSEDLIADDASTELSNLRRKIRTVHNKVKDTLQKFISGNHYQKYLQENIVTTRNGRYVIPVKAECRGDIKGLVHDTSASGATLFVEPAAVLEANNELRLLEREEEKEIDKILYTLSAMVSEVSGLLSLDYYNITEIAFIFAKAELAYRMNGVDPEITEKKELRILKGRHPLLKKETVVPIDIYLGGNFDTLVITGPNTGGKTVTLKTLGLLSMMVQCGLQPPCSSSSVFTVFDDFYSDIGDEQSIEQSLSTFSAHMTNIVAITRDAGERSLVLLDELGAGTDPVEGAALAMAILESLRAKGALIAATTHYAELKVYAIETKGVCNAGCEFDIETLRPTYKLIIGTPGRSNAFAISEKLGLSPSIIKKAKEQVSSDNQKFEQVIEQLEEKRLLQEKALEETLEEKRIFEEYKTKLEAELKKAKEQTEKEVERAKSEAASIIKSAKVVSDYVLQKAEEAKKSAAVDEARSDIRKHLREADDEINPLKERTPEKGYVLPRPLEKGDTVLVFSLNKEGTVEKETDKSGNVLVLLGSMHFKTKVQNLKLLPKKKNEQKSTVTRSTGNAASLSHEIDVRGELADDAWFLVDKYIDSALMAKMPSVHVIHGKGTGALRKRIWSELKNDKRVSTFRYGEYGEGDSGVTVIELKIK